MLEDVYQPLYAMQPNQELFHYTSIDALLSIVTHKTLWATEISYLNDTQELRLFADLLLEKINVYDAVGTDSEIKAASQLTGWIKDWFVGGALVFTTSFTENGNILSQWRGYCQHGRGVSLGFDPATIIAAAAQANFTIGRCIYEWPKHHELARAVVGRLVSLAIERGDHANMHPTQSFYPTFDEAAPEIIRIGVLCKHPSFAEEREWRCISQPVKHYVEAPIKYRAGSSALIPYLEFPLPSMNEALAVQTAIVGPSPTPDLAFNGVARYLSKYAATGQQRSIRACGIPYRA